VVAALVLVLLVLAAGLGPRRGVAGAFVLAAVAVLWLLVNGPMEGPVLWTLAPDRGLTGGDLAGLAGLGLAAYRLVGALLGGRRAAHDRVR
jgi:hypothetical protein